MYAIVLDGSKQLKVAEGQELQIDYRDASSGDSITFDKVLAHSDGEKLAFGSPILKGAKVTATVTGVGRGPKLVVQKFRRRKTHRCKNGHRQIFTNVKIEKIQLA